MCRFTLSILMFLALSTGASGQGELPGISAEKCVLGTLNFGCPKGVEFEKLNSRITAFYGTEMKSGASLFAFILEEEKDEPTWIAKVTDEVFTRRYGVKLSSFSTKVSNDFWGANRFSKHEMKRFATVGFNKDLNEFFHSHRVLMSYNGKLILVGFVNDLTSPQPVEEAFEKWRGGGQMYATYALQNLINSITGEKVKDHEAPGGPPPPMPASKAKIN